MPVSRALAPLPPPLPMRFPALRNLRALLAWGFGVSCVLHVLLAPIAGAYKAPRAESTEVSMISLSRRVTIKLPSPTPAPVPSPTRAPVPPPSPHASTVPHPAKPAPQAHLALNTFKTSGAHARGAPLEPGYRVRPGSENGAPQGTLASAPPARAADAGAAAPVVEPTPTPAAVERTPAPPACAEPNVEAKATRLADPWYPESARELGAVGEADVLVSLSATGTVTSATIFHTSGSAALDASAVRAARESTYAPEVANCIAVAGTYTFHASFTLSDAKP